MSRPLVPFRGGKKKLSLEMPYTATKDLLVKVRVQNGTQKAILAHLSTGCEVATTALLSTRWQVIMEQTCPSEALGCFRFWLGLGVITFDKKQTTQQVSTVICIQSQSHLQHCKWTVGRPKGHSDPLAQRTSYGNAGSFLQNIVLGSFWH